MVYKDADAVLRRDAVKPEITEPLEALAAVAYNNVEHFRFVGALDNFGMVALFWNTRPGLRIAEKALR
jgi:hypothetical protein